MKNSEWGDSNSLCCCEYYNIQEQRNHILGCCCNCQDLDESFESFLTGRQISPSRKSALMATIQDRIRIPWRGGAKQISPDTLIPVFLVPVCIFIAAFDLILTFLVLILIPFLLNHTFLWFRTYHPKSKFFVIWAISSFLAVAVIFEVKVIALLEILVEENIALGVLTALFFYCAYRVKVTANRCPGAGTQLGDVENQAVAEDFCTACKRKIGERMYHCAVCQTCVPERDCHFVWYDCCIGSTNNGMFLLSLVFAISSLLYSSNLTLTTVCHPFTVFETVMLPDDCSEVYEQYDMALCFTSAIYSLLMASYLLWIFLRQFLTISLGLTGQEWRQLPLSTRLCCGITAVRPYSQGFFKNWLRILCSNDNKYSKSSTYIET